MVLVCRNCGSVNSDPGGDPRRLNCGVCGLPQLQRVATKAEKMLAAGIAGATVGGLALGPIGALGGALLALLIGKQQLK
jgi:hypothetical protein